MRSQSFCLRHHHHFARRSTRNARQSNISPSSPHLSVATFTAPPPHSAPFAAAPATCSVFGGFTELDGAHPGGEVEGTEGLLTVVHHRRHAHEHKCLGVARQRILRKGIDKFIDRKKIHMMQNTAATMRGRMRNGWYSE